VDFSFKFKQPFEALPPIQDLAGTGGIDHDHDPGAGAGARGSDGSGSGSLRRREKQQRRVSLDRMGRDRPPLPALQFGQRDRPATSMDQALLDAMSERFAMALDVAS